jgi:septal ring factor EnvC (AmiA/AmiB activator)
MARTRDCNQKTHQEVNALKRDADMVAGQGHDLNRELRQTETHNSDLSHKVKNSEMNLKSLEEQLFVTRRDVECQRTVCH